MATLFLILFFLIVNHHAPSEFTREIVPEIAKAADPFYFSSTHRDLEVRLSSYARGPQHFRLFVVYGLNRHTAQNSRQSNSVFSLRSKSRHCRVYLTPILLPTTHARSSAKQLGSAFCRKVHMSQWYVMKIAGVKHDPCGPPLRMGKYLERTPFILMNATLSCSHRSTHLMYALGTPSLVSFTKQPSHQS